MEEYWFVARLSERSPDWKEVRFSVDSEDYESACVEAYRVAAEKGISMSRTLPAQLEKSAGSEHYC